MALFVFLAIPTRTRIIPANLSHLFHSELGASVTRPGCGRASINTPLHFQQHFSGAIQIREEEVQPNLTLRLITPRSRPVSWNLATNAEREKAVPWGDCRDRSC